MVIVLSSGAARAAGGPPLGGWLIRHHGKREILCNWLTHVQGDSLDRIDRPRAGITSRFARWTKRER